MKSIGTKDREITGNDPCRPECTVCGDALPSVPRRRSRCVGAQAPASAFVGTELVFCHDRLEKVWMICPGMPIAGHRSTRESSVRELAGQSEITDPRSDTLLDSVYGARIDEVARFQVADLNSCGHRRPPASVPGLRSAVIAEDGTGWA